MYGAFVCVLVFVRTCVHTFVCGYVRTDKLPIPISHRVLPESFRSKAQNAIAYVCEYCLRSSVWA